MRCLYEVLEVSRDAEAGEIKTAYRKAALRWHPDKNQDDPERASARFKEIQNAYEVLSDKQERLWYDNHRDAILRGADGSTAPSQYQAGSDGFGGGQPPDSDFDLFPYFSASCFSGYGSDENGFYSVYSDVFSRLAENELNESGGSEARGSGTSARESLRERRFPAFGDTDTPWDLVSKFYECWGPGFATYKSFAWCDEYNPASAPNRKVRRLMEEDNKKKRNRAKKEFNETVRALVAFVRKRDKRAVAAAAAAAAKRAAAAEAEAQRRAAEKAARAARAAAYREQMEHAGDDDDEDGEGGEGKMRESESEEEDEERQVLLECVACNKRFRSDAAFANHERSRKHSEAVAALRAALAEEEAALASSSESDDEESEEEEEEDGSDEGNVEADATKSCSSSSGGALEAASASSSSSSSSSEDDDDDDASIDLTEFAARLSRNGRGSGRGKATAPVESDKSDESDDDDAEENKETVEVEEEAVATTTAASVAGVATSLEKKARLDEHNEKTPEPTPKLGKAKLKKAKKAAAAAAATAVANKQPQGTTCRECGDRFPSRTQLFNHLSQTGHR